MNREREKNVLRKAGIGIDPLYSINISYSSITSIQLRDDVEGIAYVIEFDWFSHMEHISRNSQTNNCFEYIFNNENAIILRITKKEKKKIDIGVFFQN